jgi:hypothetical protein
MSAFGSLADIAAYQSKVRVTLAGFLAARGNYENGRRQQNNNHPKADETSVGRRESFVGAERVRHLLARYRCRQRQIMRVVGPEYEACRKQ